MKGLSFTKAWGSEKPIYREIYCIFNYFAHVENDLAGRSSTYSWFERKLTYISNVYHYPTEYFKQILIGDPSLL